MAQNPNWPIVTWAAAFNADPNSSASRSWVDLIGGGRLKGFDCKYGTQYELGTPETGEATVTLDNRDEALNPANTSSPWNSGSNSLKPYRPILGTATWPSTAGNGNLMNQTNLLEWFTGLSFDASTFEFGTTGEWYTFGSTPPTISVDTAQAHDGTHSLKIVWPTAANGGTNAVSDVFTNCIGPMRIGQQYTASIWMFAAAGVPKMRFQCNATVAVSAAFASAWQRVSVTFTATQVFSSFQVYPDTNTTSGQTVWIDSAMLEIGPGPAAAFTTTGPIIYPLFNGYIERYPVTWTDNGYRGGADMPCVDALAFLSHRVFKPMLDEEIEQDGAVLTLKLNDDAGTTQPVPASWSKSTRRGQIITVFSPTTHLAFGYNAVPITQEDGAQALDLNPTDASNFDYIYAPSTVPASGTGTSLEVWMHRSTKPAATEIIMSGNGNGGHAWDIGINTSGQVFVRTTTDPTIPTYAYTITDNNSSCDQGWHHIVATESASGGTTTAVLYVDGVQVGTTTRASAFPFLVQSFNVGATGAPAIVSPYAGAAGYASMYSTALSAVRVADHYNAGANGHDGDKAGKRLRRLLVWSGYLGYYVIGDGASPMGPGYGLEGQTLQDAAKMCATTEQGYVLADPGGFLTFVLRDQIRGHLTPSVVFGENTAAGEVPYQGDISFDYDPQYVFNDITVTGFGRGGATSVRKTDAASQAAYFVSTLQVDTLLADLPYVEALAARLLADYKQPQLRVSSITINPGVNPSLWPTALGLKFGDRVTVKRRTAAGVTMSADYFVVSRQHTSRPGEWKTTFELAPQPATPWVLGNATYGVLGSTTIPTF